MMTVRHAGQNLSVIFKLDVTKRLAKGRFENVDQVSCGIFGEGGRPVALGYAFRSPKDQVDDKLGMELALGRALKKLTPHREERVPFWDAFRKATK